MFPFRCNLPPDVGRCRSRRPKYHYDAQRGDCRLFFWGGCEGNDNRFDSDEECRDTCAEPSGSIALNEARVRQQAGNGVASLLPAVIQPQCRMGGDKFNLGDLVAFADGRCRVCVCDNPPQLTCTRKPCPGTTSPHAHLMSRHSMI